MFAGTESEQHDPQRHLARDVETLRGELFGPIEQGALVDTLDRQLHCVGRQDRLVSCAVDVGIDGAQRLVSFDDVAQRGAQCLHVEVPGQTHPYRDVVRAGFGIEPVEKPHALLRRRQRNTFGARRPGERDAFTSAGLPFDAHRECGNGAGIEECTYRHLRVQDRTEAGDDLGREERVPSELEEVVVEPDILYAQHIGEHSRDGFFDRGGGCTEFAVTEAELRFG